MVKPCSSGSLGVGPEICILNIYFTELSCTLMASQVVVVAKNLPANGVDIRDVGPTGLGRSPGGRNGNLLQYPSLCILITSTLFLPGESHGQRSLAGYSPWGCKESDMTEATLYASTFKISGF